MILKTFSEWLAWNNVKGNKDSIIKWYSKEELESNELISMADYLRKITNRANLNKDN